jgi:hypothetical protein
MSHSQQSPLLGLLNELLLMVTSRLDASDVFNLIQSSQQLRLLLEPSLYESPSLHSVQHVVVTSNIATFERFIPHGLIVDDYEFDSYPLLAHLAIEST